MSVATRLRSGVTSASRVLLKSARLSRKMSHSGSDATAAYSTRPVVSSTCRLWIRAMRRRESATRAGASHDAAVEPSEVASASARNPFTVDGL